MPAPLSCHRVWFGLALISLGATQLSEATTPPGFEPALPGYTFRFPYDHGAHPSYATEWWYYTGHLKTADGHRFGYELTWFRTALAPRVERDSAWAARDLYFAHFAITDEASGRFLFTDRMERGSLGMAGADPASLTSCPKVWIGPWTLQFSGPGGAQQNLRAAGTNDGDDGPVPFALDLNQKALKPPVDEGERGVSQKSAGPGHASHYYSYTRLASNGTVVLGGTRYAVTGQSWFDHEFGSDQMGDNQVGWDWFSVQLADGRDLMLYRMRLKDGGTEPCSSGTLVDAAGHSTHLKLSEFDLVPSGTWHSANSGANYPSTWEARLPGLGLDLLVAPSVAGQELRPQRSGGGLFAYWEGSVGISGTDHGRAISGAGYLEMTGYAVGMKGLV